MTRDEKLIILTYLLGVRDIFQSYAERLESTGDKSDKETALEYRASIADLRTLTEHLKAEINEMEIIQPEGEG